MQIRLGTRSSPLARWQADWVAAEMTRRGVAVELIPITTRGDSLTGPLGAANATGLFTKELQRALVDGRIDLAVHSLKDLPTDEAPGLCLAAVPLRASVWDVLVSQRGLPLADLPQGATIGTGSPRRRAQLLHHRPDLQLVDVRGNVDTRLRKVHEGQFDALVLAQAGLERLGLAAAITEVLAGGAILLPAVGQGALGLETRCDDAPLRDALAALDHRDSHQAVLAERAMLAALRGGCMAPVAAWARIEQGRLLLAGRVVGVDGRVRCDVELEAAPDAAVDAAVDLGRRVAERLLAEGAGELITAARGP